MKKSQLAINGGFPAITSKFKKYNTIGEKEIFAVNEVMKSGILSKYYGSWEPEYFYGGPKVNQFERNCEQYFNVKHAITVNSWTSGLTVAMGAIGIEPGDEVIVSPWTMCASATAILHWNAIPIFADIDRRTFCIDIKTIEKLINSRTKAILTVDIFGQSSDIIEINNLAKKYDLKVICDTAQSPGAKVGNDYAGTLSDIGGFSLNYHKHIHTGEGGILVTNDDDYAERMRMLRNHAEAVVEDMRPNDLINMVGHNYRLGEIECAIGIEQLKKLDKFVDSRQKAAAQLTKTLKNLDGLLTPLVSLKNSHVYYIYPLILDTKKISVSKYKIIKALEAEGVPGLMGGYINLHLLPIYQNKIAYGSKGFPWILSENEVSYEKGICPVAEELNENSFFGIEMCMYEYSKDEISLVCNAFEKVWNNLNFIK